jgi:hypothetical protein
MAFLETRYGGGEALVECRGVAESRREIATLREARSE